MKIKIYIVTYNSDLLLKENIVHLYESDLKNYQHEIFVINNYSIIEKFKEFPDVNILNNATRPDFSTGHLARSWNQGIINGFKDLNNPDCDILVLMQNDTFVLKNCFSDLIEYHKKYDFIAVGAGDQFMSYTVEAVKNIGIWDERFCSVGYQEADYFFNAANLYLHKVSITDYVHWRVVNRLYEEPDSGTVLIKKGWALNDHPNKEMWNHYNFTLFFEKWEGVPPHYWGLPSTVLVPKIKRYAFYPYFEKDIITLKEQNYFLSRGEYF